MTNQDWFNWGYDHGMKSSSRWKREDNPDFMAGYKQAQDELKEEKLTNLLKQEN